MLSIIIFTPILVAIGVALMGDKREGQARVSFNLLNNLIG